MKKCIVCNTENDAKSIEHIVPESLGNKDYVMEKGRLCDKCNASFSKFEEKALSHSIFVVERSRLGVQTKKGKNVKGGIGKLKIEGDSKHRKQFINIKGLKKEDILNYNPVTKTFQFKVPTVDKKSAAAMSKFLLMVGYEAIFTSQKDLFHRNDFTELKEYLSKKSNEDWGYLSTSYKNGRFKQIPKRKNIFALNQIQCFLTYQENKGTSNLLFRFKYGEIPMIINLLNRDMDWVEKYKEIDKQVIIFPENLERKFHKKRK